MIEYPEVFQLNFASIMAAMETDKLVPSADSNYSDITLC